MTAAMETLTTAVRYHQAGDLTRAEAKYRDVLDADPNQADALHLLGVIAHQQGQHELAVERIRKAIAVNPEAPAFHCNLGSVYHALGKLAEAARSYERALTINPRYAEAHNNLGNALREQGDCAEAVARFRRAIQIKPDYSDAYSNLGSALREMSNVDEAVAACRNALRIHPQSAEAHNNLGSALKDQGDLEGAVQSYRQALQINPGFVDALGNLATMLERLNRLDEAEAATADGLRTAPDHPLVNLVAAKCDERRGRYREAIDRLVTLFPTVGPRIDLAKEMALVLGRLYDRLGEPGNAFAWFTEMNRLGMQRAHDRETLKREHGENIDALRTLFTPKWIDSWTPAPAMDESQTPVFLMGFARSGNTLLDMMLSGHPQIQTLEEKPTIHAMYQEIDRLPGAFGRVVRELTPDQFAQIRAAYFRIVDALNQRRPDCLLVDRNPMATIDVGLILRIFPAARFIVLVRHPYDVCLSCFMQDFKLNAGTASLFTLEDIASLYARVMELWRQYVEVLPHAYHVVRYEDLVENSEVEVRGVLDFLGLEWHDDVLQHTDRARHRTVIATPSYRQVVEPVYQTARYRWRRYADQLRPVMDTLAPWVEHFGYTPDPGS